ncbi:MAG: 4Fe-4S binding protein [Syntrophales bacterium]|nr:4Fe-4S binding protein [Syntrophales bacterium]
MMLDFRRWIQSIATVLSNAWLLFPFTGTIYQGKLKSLCVPGLNCYSCPAAVGACPMGALQTMFASVRPSFRAGNFHIGLYVIGTLGVIGSLAGRMPCGWLCPFGFMQELVNKIPSPKIDIPSFLSCFKYAVLAIFIVALPIFAVDIFGYGENAFCKYICPAGTLQAGIPMSFLQPRLRDLWGGLFMVKMAILLFLILSMVFIRRPFCRTLCPLGAIYSLFNRVSVFKMVHHPDRCVRCGECYRNCPMGVRFYEGANQNNCIRCLQCMRKSCKYGAIGHSLSAAPSKDTMPSGGASL